MSPLLPDSRFASGSAPCQRTVLVIDDEPSVRVAISRFLARRGWTVVEAPDGEHARSILEPAAGLDVDLVICDLHMPRLSGRELYQWLVCVRPDVALRLVFSSGDAESPEFAQFLSEARRPMLPKPFELRELERIIDEVRSAARAA